jgi:hypothetical protein
MSGSRIDENLHGSRRGRIKVFDEVDRYLIERLLDQLEDQEA